MITVGGTIGILLVSSAAGVAALAEHLRIHDGSPLRAPAGLVLVGLTLLQARILWPPSVSRQMFAQRHPVFWRSLPVGVIASYLVTSTISVQAGVEYVFVALSVGWYAAGLVLLRWPRHLPSLDRAAAHPWAGAGGWCLFFGVVAAAALELGLRAYGRLVDDPLPVTVAARARQLAPGSTLRGRLVNRLGYWGGDFRRQPRPGGVRVAVLADEVALSGTATTNCFVQLERSLPGIEVYNFAIPGAGIREYAAQLRDQVLDYRPDLVLVLVSVGTDITEPLPVPGNFDLRGLRLYQLAAREWMTPGQGSTTAVVDAPGEFLCRAERQLQVCHTPLDDRTRAQWDDAESHLDDLIARSRQQGATVALAVVPTVFQVCAPLAGQLSRRAGYEPSALDLELPQRRLAAFAASRRVACIDLLPVLREAGGCPFERSSLELSSAGNQAVTHTLEHWISGRFQQLLSPAAQASAR